MTIMVLRIQTDWFGESLYNTDYRLLSQAYSRAQEGHKFRAIVRDYTSY